MKSLMIALSLMMVSSFAQADAPEIAAKCREKIINSEGLDATKVARTGFSEGAGWYSFLVKAQEKTGNLKDMIFVCLKDNSIKHCLLESQDEAEVINGGNCN